VRDAARALTRDGTSRAEIISISHTARTNRAVPVIPQIGLRLGVLSMCACARRCNSELEGPDEVEGLAREYNCDTVFAPPKTLGLS
jgi:hypothetical protein